MVMKYAFPCACRVIALCSSHRQHRFVCREGQACCLLENGALVWLLGCVHAYLHSSLLLGRVPGALGGGGSGGGQQFPTDQGAMEQAAPKTYPKGRATPENPNMLVPGGTEPCCDAQGVAQW